MRLAWASQVDAAAPALALFGAAAAASATGFRCFRAAAVEAGRADSKPSSSSKRAADEAATASATKVRSACFALCAGAGPSVEHLSQLATLARLDPATVLPHRVTSSDMVVGALLPAPPVPSAELWVPPQQASTSSKHHHMLAKGLRPTAPVTARDTPHHGAHNSIMQPLWDVHDAIDMPGAQLQRAAMAHRFAEQVCADSSALLRGESASTAATWLPGSLRRCAAEALVSLRFVNEAEPLSAANACAMAVMRRGTRVAQQLRRAISALQPAQPAPAGSSSASAGVNGEDDGWGLSLAAAMKIPASGGRSDGKDPAHRTADVDDDVDDDDDDEMGFDSAEQPSQPHASPEAAKLAVSRLRSAASDAYGLVLAHTVRESLCSAFSLTAQRVYEFKPRNPSASDRAKAAARSAKPTPSMTLSPPWIEAGTVVPVPRTAARRLLRLLEAIVASEGGSNQPPARAPRAKSSTAAVAKRAQAPAKAKAAPRRRNRRQSKREAEFEDNDSQGEAQMESDDLPDDDDDNSEDEAAALARALKASGPSKRSRRSR
jgi:hypothetical protein